LAGAEVATPAKVLTQVKIAVSLMVVPATAERRRR
jgi:hypothetical protein